MNQNARFMTNWNKMNKTIEQNAENKRKARFMTNWNKMNKTIEQNAANKAKAIKKIELIKRNEPSEIDKVRQAIMIMKNGGYISTELRNKAAQAIGGQSLYNEVNINKRFTNELKQVCKILTVLDFSLNIFVVGAYPKLNIIKFPMIFELLNYANGIVRSWNFPTINSQLIGRGKNMTLGKNKFEKEQFFSLRLVKGHQFVEAQQHPEMFAIFREIKKIIRGALRYNLYLLSKPNMERLAALFFYQIFSFRSIFKIPALNQSQYLLRDELKETQRQAAKLLRSIRVPDGQALMMSNAYEEILKMTNLPKAIKALESTKFPTDPYWNTKWLESQWLESQRPRINNINRVNVRSAVRSDNIRPFVMRGPRRLSVEFPRTGLPFKGSH